MRERDGHIRVLPLHVANKIAAGEVVERPASVVKELVENAIDAHAKSIRISIVHGGRKLVSVQDDGCGMTRDDALLSLERQATSKIMDVDDIEEIDTLGFRGEAIPSIASVSRFSITTRRHEDDEGTRVEVNAGVLADVRPAGTPPGTLVEVRDLFCNVPARRKFLRSQLTEEGHVRNIFTVNALAHPGIAFSLTVDGREIYRLAPSSSLIERIREIFGEDFASALVPLDFSGEKASVTGFIERPNASTPSRKEQYVFINARPATAPAVAYALREAYPRRQGDAKPAAVIFISVSPKDVDVNVHPTKREVRFRDNTSVRLALMEAISSALDCQRPQPAALPRDTTMPVAGRADPCPPPPPPPTAMPMVGRADPCPPLPPPPPTAMPMVGRADLCPPPPPPPPTAMPMVGRADPCPPPPPPPIAVPVEAPLPMPPAPAEKVKPWVWNKYLATTETGYLLFETDSGIVTVNPRAARERIAFEKLASCNAGSNPIQDLLLPEMVRLSPAAFARIEEALDAIRAVGFRLEPFGKDTIKVEAVPLILGDIPVAATLSTIAEDLASTGSARRSTERWREDAIAKSIAKSFAGMEMVKMDEASANLLVEDLIACRMPYVTPAGKSVMIFTSLRELDRKFGKY